MRVHYGLVVLLTFTACTKETPEATESASSALGSIPPTETAQWKQLGSTTLPSTRYGQAVALDETRGVVVMFGGITGRPETGLTALQDVWEWSLATGAWKPRAAVGTIPDARSGAALAYDSTRKKFVLFGGRTGSGYDLQDTWEWDPATGAWADNTGAGSSPSARSQHGMLFDSKNGKVLLFGGGRSELGGDPMNLYLTFADTWEYDGTRWTQRTTATAPSARAAFGFAYSSGTNKAYLFGGMEILTTNAPSTLKQDSWEYDGTAGTWTERTAAGSKPSPRYGHGMAIDSTNGLAVIFGGFDIGTAGSKNDVWNWSLASGTWQSHDAPGGALWPGKRKWASLIMGGSATRAYLVGGLISDSGGGYDAGIPLDPGASWAGREVWELNPSTTTWLNRSAANDTPGARVSHAMTSDPITGKVYLYGGADNVGNVYDDLWEWNGSKWVECTGDVKPPARASAAISYDPVRKSLILFGGNSVLFYQGWDSLLSDTWEWNIGTRKWSQLHPALSPAERHLHAMVTDTTRQKVILFGGENLDQILYPPGGNVRLIAYELWEWDGGTGAWTDRSPAIEGEYPNLSSHPAMIYDEGSKKVEMFVTSYYGAGNASYWEWDPDTGALSAHVINDIVNVTDTSVVYDSIRRRTVAAGTPLNPLLTSPPMGTYELDSATSTWYQRSVSQAPSSRILQGMAFDRKRGVVVLYGGREQWAQTVLDDLWEYQVGGWGNGTGCTSEFASQCASGYCVDGVCCESAACSGACKSCNVAGKAGTCVLAAPGTQVTGSCSGDQACDATGACKTSNGKACASAAVCASGFCVEGVCCNAACTGDCVSCNQAGKAGTCAPFVAGTDPEKECSQGTPPCQSVCDGVGNCVYPSGVSCGTCGYCNGTGTCQEQWYCATATGRSTGTATSIPRRDGGADTGIWTGSATVPLTSTGSAVTTWSRTDLTTATSTLSLSTLTATGTGTFVTVPTTSTRTTAATETGTSTPTATSAGTASTGNVTTTRTDSSTAARTASGTSSISTSGTDTATASASANTAKGTGTSTTSASTASKTSTVTTASRDAGAGDGGGSKLGHSGCSCELGGKSGGSLGPSLLGLLGTCLVLRGKRRRR